jgi:putative DNA primase/helicase
LLKLLNADNGGFHLRGNSSCGKTICLAAGSSVWGGDSLIRTWNTTVNGLEGVATMHNDVLLPLDELGQADGKAAGEAAYMIGNGQGKSRANREGDARSVKRFRTLLLSSGEKSLSDVMASVGQMAMAGQEVRIIEIAADADCGYGAFENIHGSKTSQEFAERLKRAVSENYGHAGRAFVEYLANPDLQPKLVAQIKTSIQRFVDTYVPAEAVGQVSRAGQRFGLVAAAGEICIELGILPWTEGEAIDACRKCFMAWIELRGGIGNHEAEQAVATVRRFIELHGESRFTLWVKGGYVDTTNDLDARFKTISRVGFRCVTGDGRYEYYILPEAYNTEICRGLNPTGVTKELVKRGHLHLNSEGKAQVEVRLPGIGKKRVYHLNPDLMGDVSPKLPKWETAGRQSNFREPL